MFGHPNNISVDITSERKRITNRDLYNSTDVGRLGKNGNNKTMAIAVKFENMY